MRQALRARAKLVGPVVCAAPVLLLALAACLPEGGYDKVTHREQEELPQPDFPAPPRVIAGIGQSAAATKLVATNLPAGVTQAMVDEGQQAYGTVCVACHAANGTGSAVAPALNDNRWINISGEYPEIVQVITNGVPVPKEHPGPMPPKGGGNFTDPQIRAIAAYVYALSHQGGGA
jgi:mono/diheme cytochrome c family protein